jgi:xylan 1,4-beta-xylosidase
MGMIHNPVLRGFNPDPSVVRVGDDYYIATSTFEWFPGVQIHHSRDLIHWELVAHPLRRVSQLDLRGVAASRGVWAPCLTYDGGTFYLVYTVVHSFMCLMYDTQNYLVTATDICGEWSEPVPLNAYGFDPSLFHDDDGRKYLVSMITDHRPGREKFGGIVLQEFSAEKRKMLGPAKKIFTRPGQLVEGPHLLKRNGFYYLFLADGGTGEQHGESVARSRRLWGGYEWYDRNPFLTARHSPEHPLQKTGHADLVQTQNGEWYMCHLCGRPLENRMENGERCYPLGRETAIQKVEWTPDGWIRLANGTTLADVNVQAPDLPEHPFPIEPVRDNFDSPKLNINFQSLRIPLDDSCCSLSARPGWLRLYGHEGVNSTFRQSLIARRWQSFRFRAGTRVDFYPECFKQMAGLICLYDQDNFYYLHVTWSEEQGRCLNLISGINNQYRMLACVPVPGTDPVNLAVEVNHDRMQFFYSFGGGAREKIGPVNDASTLSDEACHTGWFTGAFVGLCCQDLTGCSHKEADFDWFDYQELP